MADTLRSDEKLGPDECLRSSNGKYVLFMQGDGNLVLYFLDASSGADKLYPMWQSGTAGHPGSIAWMQGDGNFVIYAPGNVAIGNTKTAGHPRAWIQLQIDGNLVVYAPGAPARPLWHTHTYDTLELSASIVDLHDKGDTDGYNRLLEKAGLPHVSSGASRNEFVAAAIRCATALHVLPPPLGMLECLVELVKLGAPENKEPREHAKDTIRDYTDRREADKHIPSHDMR